MSNVDSKKILIINAHQYYPFAEGKLNAALVDKAATMLAGKGYNTRVVTMSDEHDIEEQLAHHQWADIIFYSHQVIGWVYLGRSKSIWTMFIQQVWAAHYVLVMGEMKSS